jgi:hypothetical protein
VSDKAYEAQLAALDQLRAATPESASEPLRKALKHPSNYMVAKAAAITGGIALRALIPDLLAALDRFFTEEDQQCWAKNALVDALAGFEHGDSDVYLRGLKHVQMEPVWGGSVDTAGPLRARCALALVYCKDLSDIRLLGHLIEVLVDPDKTVRVEAARAIGRVERPESALLLRLRVLTGDAESEVLGACFQALLGIDPDGVRFVSQFLGAGDDRAAEAALALGMTRLPAVFPVLKDHWDRQRDPVFGGTLLAAIGLTSLPEAVDFLIGVVAADGRGSTDAVRALASARLTDEARQGVQATLDKVGNARLSAAWKKHSR